MELGISLDASAVSQRHCLDDSDDDEGEDEVDTEQTEVFTSPLATNTCVDPGTSLIVAIGLPASIFLKSHLNLELVPSCTIETNSHRVFKDKHFSPNAQNKAEAVSEVFDVKCKAPESEKFLACTHEQQLNSQHCNLWCTRVSVRSFHNIEQLC